MVPEAITLLVTTVFDIVKLLAKVNAVVGPLNAVCVINDRAFTIASSNKPEDIFERDKAKVKINENSREFEDLIGK